jgi:hypothetical protein
MKDVRFLKIQHYSDHPEVASAAEFLVESLMSKRQRRRDADRYLRDAKKLIASLWMKGEADLFRFTTKAEYFSASKRKQVWMTSRVKTLFNEMRELEWVHLVKKAIPPHSSTKSSGGQSAIYCRTKKFKDLLITLSHVDILPNPDAPRVELRDEDRVLIELPESYQSSKAYEHTKKVLGDHYELLKDSDIRFSDSKPAPLSMLYFVRKFRPDLSSGGRFYASIQNMPKQERLGMTMGGKAVASLDISQLHPALILRLTQGVEREVDSMLFPALKDAYVMPGYAELPRAVHKKLINTLFNAATEDSAARSLMNTHYWYDIFTDEWVVKSYKGGEKREGFKVFPIKPKKSAIAYIEVFKLHHPAFTSAICSGIGSKLQLLDSQLIELMMSIATAAEVPVIPVHDEIILPNDAKTFAEVMLERSFRATIKEAGQFGVLAAKWSDLNGEEEVKINLGLQS